MNAVTQYNKIMFDICREYDTIGTSYTECPESRNQWNLRDLVSEMQYTLDVYTDPNCMEYEDAHSETWDGKRSPYFKEWQSLTRRMKRFIDKYKAEALTMECMECHCSRWD